MDVRFCNGNSGVHYTPRQCICRRRRQDVPSPTALT